MSNYPLRDFYIEWGKKHLAGRIEPVEWNVDGVKVFVKVQITATSIKKSLRDKTNQSEQMLSLIYRWADGLYSALYLQPEPPQHRDQKNVRCYHRLRWELEPGICMDIVIRELLQDDILQLYFIHPTKQK